MTLIAGLGNPGKQYKNNRHNIGFMAIDLLVKDLHAVDVSKTSFFGEVFKAKDILLLKPTTFMNNSGKSVLAVKNFYKPTKIIVIHDDLDLAFGAIKFKFAGGNGGHNGLKSIDAPISNEYFGVRMGISKPSFKSEIAHYVLNDFTALQSTHLLEWIQKATTATLKLISEPLETVSCAYSQKSIRINTL